MSSSEGPSSSIQPLASEVEQNLHTIGPVDPDTEEEELSISEERCETYSEESQCLSVCCKDIIFKTIPCLLSMQNLPSPKWGSTIGKRHFRSINLMISVMYIMKLF